MKIAVKGQQTQVEEFQSILPQGADATQLKGTELEEYDVIFDLDFDDDPEWLEQYAQLKGALIIVGAVKVQLEELNAVIGGKPLCHFVGMNTLPSFIARDLMELTAIDETARIRAQELFESWGLQTSFVESRVGMVTPRIVCMIINEAFFTVQEGTASKEDIDLGMKLGTAYPKGPFDWADQIGIINVFEVLNAMYEDTRDERYKICPLLKSEYLRAMAS